jgi:hypothetical protein
MRGCDILPRFLKVVAPYLLNIIDEIYPYNDDFPGAVAMPDGRLPLSRQINAAYG